MTSASVRIFTRKNIFHCITTIGTLFPYTHTHTHTHTHTYTNAHGHTRTRTLTKGEITSWKLIRRGGRGILLWKRREGELPLEIKGVGVGVAKQNRVFYVDFAMVFTLIFAIFKWRIAIRVVLIFPIESQLAITCFRGVVLVSPLFTFNIFHTLWNRGWYDLVIWLKLDWELRIYGWSARCRLQQRCWIRTWVAHMDGGWGA